MNRFFRKTFSVFLTIMIMAGAAFSAETPTFDHPEFCNLIVGGTVSVDEAEKERNHLISEITGLRNIQKRSQAEDSRLRHLEQLLAVVNQTINTKKSRLARGIFASQSTGSKASPEAAAKFDIDTKKWDAAVTQAFNDAVRRAKQLRSSEIPTIDLVVLGFLQGPDANRVVMRLLEDRKLSKEERTTIESEIRQMIAANPPFSSLLEASKPKDLTDDFVKFVFAYAEQARENLKAGITDQTQKSLWEIFERAEKLAGSSSVTPEIFFMALKYSTPPEGADGLRYGHLLNDQAYVFFGGEKFGITRKRLEASLGKSASGPAAQPVDLSALTTRSAAPVVSPGNDSSSTAAQTAADLPVVAVDGPSGDVPSPRPQVDIAQTKFFSNLSELAEKQARAQGPFDLILRKVIENLKLSSSVALAVTDDTDTLELMQNFARLQPHQTVILLQTRLLKTKEKGTADPSALATLVQEELERVFSKLGVQAKEVVVVVPDADFLKDPQVELVVTALAKKHKFKIVTTAKIAHIEKTQAQKGSLSNSTNGAVVYLPKLTPSQILRSLEQDYAEMQTLYPNVFIPQAIWNNIIQRAQGGGEAVANARLTLKKLFWFSETLLKNPDHLVLEWVQEYINLDRSLSTMLVRGMNSQQRDGNWGRLGADFFVVEKKIKELAQLLGITLAGDDAKKAHDKIQQSFDGILNTLKMEAGAGVEPLVVKLEEWKKFFEDQISPRISAAKKGKLEISSRVYNAALTHFDGKEKALKDYTWQFFAEMKAYIKSRVLDQDEAIDKFINVLAKRFVMPGPGANKGNFLFVGPSGVGKTTLFNFAVEFVYSRDAKVTFKGEQIASREFADAKLNGAPAGYLRSDEEPALATKYRTYEGRIGINIDEVEKAKGGLIVFMPFLEDEEVTLNDGTVIKTAEIFMTFTSNLFQDISIRPLEFLAMLKSGQLIYSTIDGPTMRGAPPWTAEDFQRLADLTGREEDQKILTDPGFDPASEEAKKVEFTMDMLSLMAESLFKAHGFPQEFLNRALNIIVFRPLTKDSVRNIAKVRLQLDIRDVLVSQGYNDIDLELTAAAYERLASLSYKPEWGARKVIRTLEEMVGTPFWQMVQEGLLPNGQSVIVDYSGNKFVFTRISSQGFKEAQQRVTESLHTPAPINIKTALEELDIKGEEIKPKGF